MGLNKNLVKLDWASTENGSHILTVGLGNQIFVYSCITKELDKLHSFSSSSTPSSSSEIRKGNDQSLVRWTQFRSFELDSADDMQALPSQIKWVREGLLIVGLSTEMQIFSQWSSLNQSLDEAKTTTSLSGDTTPLLLMPQQQQPTTTNSFEFKSLLKVPKNHSVLDLNKLSKLTRETSRFAKTRKHDENNVDAASVSSSKRGSLIASRLESENDKSTVKKTRVFDENQMLEVIQDSGLFMQTK